MTEPLTEEPSKHSSIVGGSNAERRLACPASYKLEQRVPEAMRDRSSVYADEGTALHSAMEHILRNNIQSASDVAGMEFNGVVMTAELIDEALQPALGFFDDLCDRLYAEDGDDLVIYLEQQVHVPGIPDARGTADVIGCTSKRSVVVDWKFGAGKAVYATRLDGSPNAQGMFYARGGVHSLPDLFKPSKAWPVDIYFVQPRLRDRAEGAPIYQMASTTVGALEKFRMDLVRAIAEATGDNPSMAAGPHCTFATCKAVCPLHLGPMLDMTLRADVAKPEPDFVERLPDLLDMADLAETAISTLRQMAHSWLEAGNNLPGWKLVDKRATRKWVDVAEATATLRGAGLTDGDLFGAPELRSPAQIEKALKKMKQSLPEDLVTAVSSGTTLARAEDRRDDITPLAARVRGLAEKLAILQK